MAQADLLNEEQVLSWLGIDQRSLRHLRLMKGLPYHPITATARFYVRSKVLEWVKKQQPDQSTEQGQ